MWVLWRFMIALFLALCLVSTSSNSAVAQTVKDFFSFSYDVQFSKTQIVGSELFNATVEATANCREDLPWPYSLASEVEITANIIAKHNESYARVTLNSSYTLTIDPFPSNKGETANTSQVVPLQFPQGSQSGTYSVIAELIKARVKAGGIWIDVTALLPSSETVDRTITYVASGGTGGGAGGGGGGGPPGGGGGVPGSAD